MSEAVQEAPIRLPTVGQVDPKALAEEKEFLADAESRKLGARLGAYTKLSGPGWLQGAMTLGGGTAASSLLAGTATGYEFLWVQPLAMMTGIVMLMAISHLTLSTRQRPFEFVCRYAHPALAWGWGLASLLASIVWSFPQFSLSESVLSDMGSKIGIPTGPVFTAIVSIGILAFTLFITLNYGKDRGWIKRYEMMLKLMVGTVIVSFLAVVLNVDVPWGDVWGGMTGFSMPDTQEELGIVVSAFAAAVGINMTFLFPYSQMARGWGKEHRGLARFDLWTGLFIPFVLATSCIIIASSATLHGTFDIAERKPGAVDLAKALEPAVGPRASHFIFGLGILGMTISSIPLLMLVSGFIVSEMTRSHSRKAFVAGALMPAVGVFGPIVWAKYGFWMAVPTSTLCFFLMPIAYLTFFMLMNRRALLGESMPRGIWRILWNTAMVVVLAIVSYGGYYVLSSKQGAAWAATSVVYLLVLACAFSWGVWQILRHEATDA